MPFLNRRDVLDQTTVRARGISEVELECPEARERHELERRIHLYRGDRPPPDLRDRTVILVDDGLATGVTARAAIELIRGQRPRRLILAAPVCADETAQALRALVHDVMCVEKPFEFWVVGGLVHELRPDLRRRSPGTAGAPAPPAFRVR